MRATRPAGACCLSTGGCIDGTVESTCTLFGGEWSEGVSCDSDPCYIPPTGARCVGIECIDDRTEAECTKLNGAWQGEDVICDQYTCAPTGGCCTGDTCTIEYEIDCTGTYLGDGTTCEGDPCYIPPTGAAASASNASTAAPRPSAPNSTVPGRARMSSVTSTPVPPPAAAVLVTPAPSNTRSTAPAPISVTAPPARRASGRARTSHRPAACCVGIECIDGRTEAECTKLNGLAGRGCHL